MVIVCSFFLEYVIYALLDVCVCVLVHFLGIYLYIYNIYTLFK